MAWAWTGSSIGGWDPLGFGFPYRAREATPGQILAARTPFTHLEEIVARLQALPLSTNPKSSLTVARWGGGTSINSIPQTAGWSWTSAARALPSSVSWRRS